MIKMNFLFIFLCITLIGAVPANKSNLTSLRKNPGIEFNRRVIGGSLAQAKQFPWQVAVYFDTADGTYFCGGALIKTQWVLTAAHCVRGATIFTLHLGANTLVDDDPNRVTVATAESEIHPDFNPNTNENNIGLIKLQSPVELNDYIKLISLPTAPLAAGTKVQASGWGASGGDTSVVNDLEYVELTVISNAECTATFGDVIKDSMVCTARTGGIGVCTGDLGGALIEITASGRPQHVGVISFFSDAGCDSEHPDGYTRTESYLAWIRETTA